MNKARIAAALAIAAVLLIGLLLFWPADDSPPAIEPAAPHDAKTTASITESAAPLRKSGPAEESAAPRTSNLLETLRRQKAKAKAPTPDEATPAEQPPDDTTKGSITGIVRYGGVPQRNWEVKVIASLFNNPKAVTDNAGRYRFKNITPGPIFVAVGWQPNYPASDTNAMMLPVLVVADNESVVDFDIPVMEGAVEGHVTYDGQAVTSGTVSVFVGLDEASPGWTEAEIGADGYYLIEQIPERELQLRTEIVPPDLRKRVKVLPFTAQSGRVTRVDVAFVPGAATLSGTITSPYEEDEILIAIFAGEKPIKPLMDAMESAMDVLILFQDVVASDALVGDGRYSYEGLEPGVYTVAAMSIDEDAVKEIDSNADIERVREVLSGILWKSERVQLEESQEFVLDFVLE